MRRRRSSGRVPIASSRPRCAILAASPKARRLVSFLVDNAGLRLEVVPLSWSAADEFEAWDRCAVLVVDVAVDDEVEKLAAIRRRARRDLPVIALAAPALEDALRRNAITVLGRPLHASRMVGAIRDAAAGA